MATIYRQFRFVKKCFRWKPGTHDFWVGWRLSGMVTVVHIVWVPSGIWGRKGEQFTPELLWPRGDPLRLWLGRPPLSAELCVSLESYSERTQGTRGNLTPNPFPYGKGNNRFFLGGWIGQLNGRLVTLEKFFLLGNARLIRI